MRVPSWLSRLLPAKKHGKRRFDAAQYTRLTASWAQADRSINTELRADLDALRRRSRDLVKNEPLAQKYMEMVTTNVVGANGFTLQARVSDGKVQDGLANAAIEAAWMDWSRATNCDVSGRMSFPDMTRAIIRGVARDGEALVRIREGANNKYGYALQFLDIERLDTMLNREQEPGLNQIIMGVEMDGDGRPVAYHLLTAPLGRDPVGRKHARIPASEIIHLFITDDPEQVRGVPWMHASMIRIHHLKGFQEAAIVAARVGASKMGFFTSKEGNPSALQDGEDEAGVPFTEAEPGQFGMLPEGYSFESFNPDYPHANYEPFVKGAKRDIGSGFGAAYHSLANDLEGVNFSSIRSGTLEERDNWMLIQRWLVGSLLETVYPGWMDNSLLSGAILLPNGSALPAAKRQKFMAHEFQGRRWQWVDPLKDITASVLAIENGLASPYTIASQQGLDAEDVLDDIARFQAAIKARGIVLGSAAQPAPAPADPVEPDEDDADTTDTKKQKSSEFHQMLQRVLDRPAQIIQVPTAPIEVKAGDVKVENITRMDQKPRKYKKTPVRDARGLVLHIIEEELTEE